jgi:fructokinase
MTAGAGLFGCIEGGGTKFVLGLLAGSRGIVETRTIPTGAPAETIGRAIDWLTGAAERNGALSDIGIASFGPLELDRSSARWGFITGTPKPGWRDTDLAGPFARAFGVPIGFDTDVNGAAMAESRWGAGKGQRICAYVTVGTGIGGGLAISGQSLRGLSHPEMGHIFPRRHPDDGAFGGTCPWHGDCLEGLASGPAILARWGMPLSELPPDHPGHDIIAYYIAQLCLTLQAAAEPGRIVIGGGVAGAPGLHDRIAMETARLGAGYFRGRADKIIVPPAFGDQAGLMGALAIAMDARDDGP